MRTDATVIYEQEGLHWICFLIGGTAVSCELTKQQSVALPSTEAECMVLSDATKEAIYMKRLLKVSQLTWRPSSQKNNNISTPKPSVNPGFHARFKHVDIRYHFIRDGEKKKEIAIEHVPTEEMTADILTKELTRANHENCENSPGI